MLYGTIICIFSLIGIYIGIHKKNKALIIASGVCLILVLSIGLYFYYNQY